MDKIKTLINEIFIKYIQAKLEKNEVGPVFNETKKLNSHHLT